MVENIRLKDKVKRFGTPLSEFALQVDQFIRILDV